MLSHILYVILSCAPLQNSICTREFNPVCANHTTYSNPCMARTAGFHGECEHFITEGECNASVHVPTCASHEFLSERGLCVRIPWSDFDTCEEEKRQAACPGGNDPNDWVAEHCANTCGVFVRTGRGDDGGGA